MFKLVVLSALLALVAAEPSTLFYGPTAYSTVLAPATTTITKQASSVVHPSPPLVYSSPLTLAHFIKKRSVAALPLTATTYYSNGHFFNTPLATTYSAPLVHSTPLIHAPILPAAPLPYVATHLIKKRSAPFLPTVIAPTYAASAPLVASTYTTPLHATTLHTAPLISHPITYTPHFIKKRSAPLLTTYAALPTSYSHQSRVDYSHTSPYITTYSSPYAYTSPYALSHVL